MRSKGTMGRLGCMALAAFFATACADEQLGDDLQSEEAVEETTLPQQSGSTKPPPNELNITGVSAQGSGCPPGSWTQRVMEDGKAFTMTFAKYGVAVAPNVAFQTKNCMINIVFDSPRGYSYAITKLSYSGLFNLEQGVTAQQSAYYTWAGVGSATVDGGIPFAVNRVVGPKEDFFIFDDNVATTDRVWSQCGVKRTLTVRTRVDLTNSNPRRNGEFNVHSLDGSTQTKLVISFAKQTCTP